MTFEIATGPRATLAVETLDAIEPQLLAFLRGTARWLDPGFPQHGTRGPAQRGGWSENQAADQVGNEVANAVDVDMQQVDELLDGRGVRIIRLHRAPTSEGAHEGAIRLQVVGLAHSQLELRWNFAASAEGLRGTSAELTLEGVQHEACVADFRRWFGS
jgi:hypothetical protein